MKPTRVVVDSSGWIEVVTDGGQAEHFLALMADESSLVVPAISILEVPQWILLEHREARAIQAAAVMQCAQVVDLDTRLALAAASWPRPEITRPGYTMDSDFRGIADVEWIEAISRSASSSMSASLVHRSTWQTAPFHQGGQRQRIWMQGGAV